MMRSALLPRLQLGGALLPRITSRASLAGRVQMSSILTPRAAAPPPSAKHSISPLRSAFRSLCSGAQALEEQYARPLQWVHWLTAFGTIAIIGTVKGSQWTTGPTILGTKGETKATLMLWHKSTAVLVTALFVPRVLLRMFTKLPAELEGHFVEHILAKIGHASLYAFMLAMPATGMAMGYFGGKGVPFFGVYTIPGKVDKTPEDGKFAGKMFKLHKQWGFFYPYVIGGHLSAVGYHLMKGQAILTRINPLATLPK
ncbi:hypothetical protein AB1Y20_003938 [Prymnesium parvum]|uniref:Cytochrome b561 bacterial/Ni-hydrogenase domain-containing protein n=1 Tax=Prymnesium parvum TaxID=97485 RepID=A0AB34J589_PRYPA